MAARSEQNANTPAGTSAHCTPSRGEMNRQLTAVFQQQRSRRAFERARLPQLRTMLDFDIACEVGFHQIVARPLIVKQLLLLGLGPAVSVIRHLNALCSSGVVERTPGRNDL